MPHRRILHTPAIDRFSGLIEKAQVVERHPACLNEAPYAGRNG
jgi:hypothetical protein